MKICLFDAWHEGDPALINSHWVAEQTAVALAHLDPGAVLKVIASEHVTLITVEAELAQPHDGFAYFGHGREHLLYLRRDDRGEPIPVLGAEQVKAIGDRWFHAFACLSGETLCREAAAAGAAAYLGYRVKVVVVGRATIARLCPAIARGTRDVRDPAARGRPASARADPTTGAGCLGPAPRVAGYSRGGLRPPPLDAAGGAAHAGQPAPREARAGGDRGPRFRGARGAIEQRIIR
jgi:hypothetical protein